MARSRFPWVLAFASLAACTKSSGDTSPVPDFTWKDTAVLGTYEPVVSLATPPRHVVMLSIDTLRKDHLGRYGGGATPFLDELLATGVALDDHVQCANWTFGSTTCTLTGRHPEELRVFPTLSVVPAPLPSDLGTLASWLADEGWATVLVSYNQWLSPIVNNVQGYERVTLPGEEGRTALEVWAEGEAMLDEAIAEGADRWLLHLHFMEPHAPYLPPDSYLGGLEGLEPVPWDLADKDQHYDALDDWGTLTPEEQAALEAHLRVRYEGEVRWLDDQLQIVWAELDARGWLDDTLVVLWSDHGEQFWEHGRQTHAWQLFGEENDAVAVFWGKDLSPRAWSGPTSAVDLVPTVLTAVGVPVPPEAVGVALGGARSDRVRFMATSARSGVEQALVRDGTKLRYHWSGLAQMFDRGADPGETDDRWDPEDPVARELWDILQVRTEALAPLTSATPTDPPGL